MKPLKEHYDNDPCGSDSPEISFLVFDDSESNPQNPQDVMLAQKFWKQFELEPQMESKLVAMDRVNQSSRHNSYRRELNNQRNSATSVRSTPMALHKRSSGNLRPTTTDNNHQTGGASALDQSSSIILEQQKREQQKQNKISSKPGSSQARLRKYTQKPVKPTSSSNNDNKSANISEMVRQLKSNSNKFQKKKDSKTSQELTNGNIRNATNSSSINFNEESYGGHLSDSETDIQEMDRELAQLDAFEIRQGLCS